MSHVSVYFIQAGGRRGNVKIGIAADIRKRLESLRTGNADDLELIFEQEFETRSEALIGERGWHGFFSDLRIGSSEWFRWSPDIADAIALLLRIEEGFYGEDAIVRMELVRNESGVQLRPARSAP